MGHPTRTSREKRLTPRSTGLLQKFFAFVGQEPAQPQPNEQAPRLQIVVAQLKMQLVTARFPLMPADEDRIHTSVDSYVDLMKNAGQPPEQVVIGLKRILRDCGIWGDRQPGAASNASARLWENSVGWCIQRYYFAGE